MDPLAAKKGRVNRKPQPPATGKAKTLIAPPDMPLNNATFERRDQPSEGKVGRTSVPVFQIYNILLKSLFPTAMLILRVKYQFSKMS